jgi:hypothetical protein
LLRFDIRLRLPAIRQQNLVRLVVHSGQQLSQKQNLPGNKRKKKVSSENLNEFERYQGAWIIS